MLSVSEGVRVRQWVYLHTGTLPVAGNLKSGKTLRHSKQLEGRRPKASCLSDSFFTMNDFQFSSVYILLRVTNVSISTDQVLT